MSKNAGYTPLHGNPNGGKDKPSNGYGSKLGTDNWMFNAKNRQVWTNALAPKGNDGKFRVENQWLFLSNLGAQLVPQVIAG